MKGKTIILLLAMLVLARAISLTANDKEGAKGEKEFRYIPQNAFGYGEKLEYEVGYKFIKAGTGYLQILPEGPSVNGRKTYDVRFGVESLKSLEMIYKVKDNYRTIMDVAGLFPYSFEQRIREGGYKKDAKATFDHNNNVAHSGDKKVKIEDYTLDVLSALYNVRTWDLDKMKKGQVRQLKNFIDDTTFTLGVKYLGKTTVEVPAGKFETHIIEPLVVQGGLFKSEGKIVVYMTADERKIPVKVATKVLIGYVSADLVKYSGVRGEVSAKKN